MKLKKMLKNSSIQLNTEFNSSKYNFTNNNMGRIKKTILMSMVLLIGLILFANASSTQGHTHSYGAYYNFDYMVHRRYCSCGAYESASHSFSSATCTKAPTCTVCGATSVWDSALGHNYSAATCTTAKTCTRCGTTSGSALGHDYSSTWSTDSGTHWRWCSRSCGAYTDWTSHSGGTNTCTAGAACSTCGYVYGSALGHAWPSSYSTTSTQHYKNCTRCSTRLETGNHVDNDKNGLCETCNYRMYWITAVPTGKSLTYNHASQYGINDAAQVNGQIGYTFSGTTSATDAGSYTATATLKSGYRWTGAETGTKTVSWSIAKLDDASNPTLTSVTKTYDTTSLSIGVSGGHGGTIYYSSKDGSSGTWSSWTTTKPSRTNAGTTYVKAYVKADSNHSRDTSETGSYTITISKRDAINPTLTSVSKNYDGSALSISVSGGRGGTYYYKTSENNSTWSSWTTTVPTRTNYGTTYVRVYVAGDGNHNSTSESASATITINRRPITISWSSTTTFTYNNSYQAPTLTVSSGVTGQTLNVSRTQQIDAGTYTSTATIDSVSGGDVNNYTLANPTIQYTINKKSIATQWGGTTFTYNNAQQGPTASATSGVTGETLNITRTTAIDAGTYTSTATLSSVTGGQGKTANYTLTNTTIQYTINKKSVAAVWGTDTTFTYDNAYHAPSVSAASGVTGETLNLVRTQEIDAGTYTSTASIQSVTGGQAKVANYTLTNTTKQFTINKKDISVTADDKVKIYGDVNPALTVTIGPTGVGSEVGSVSGALTTPATQFSNIGTYDINKGTIALADNLPFKAANYNMIFTKGTMTINPATPVIRLTNNQILHAYS